MSDINKKQESLASAIYLITSFFNEQEPLKWKLRTLASEFITLSVSYKDNQNKEREGLVLETKNLILKITSLLSVAKNAGLLSAENYALMEGGLIKYVNELGPQTNVSALLETRFSQLENKELEPEFVVKDKSREPLPEKRELLGSGPKEKALKEFGAVSVKKNSRQSIIIGILKRKKEIMIKDVSSLINGCSEKTIQRELSAMVQAGVLKKQGEKRWSRYSLA
ncbi:MAG: hypothetical protein WD896_01725 [Parcubacteria group bacterium]